MANRVGNGSFPCCVYVFPSVCIHVPTRFEQYPDKCVIVAVVCINVCFISILLLLHSYILNSVFSQCFPPCQVGPRGCSLVFPVHVIVLLMLLLLLVLSLWQILLRCNAVIGVVVVVPLLLCCFCFCHCHILFMQI